MPVTVKFQPTGTVPGDGRPVQMQGNSLTIGRGEVNDVVLPDPDRWVSKHHCAIEDQNGNVVVIDLSRNGTFLNYGKVPLGRAPTPLNDGDILSIGNYELVVEIASEAATDPGDLPPLDAGPVSHGRAAADDFLGEGSEDDFLDDLLGGSSAPKGHGSVSRPDLADDAAGGGLLPEIDPLDLLAPSSDPGGSAMPQHTPATSDAFRAPTPQQGPTIPDEWDSLLDPAGPPADEGGGESPFRTDPPGTLPPSSGGAPERTAPPRQDVSPPTPTGTPATPDRLLETFLEAVDMSDLRVSREEAPAVMARIGRVFRTLVEGVREVLMARAALKSEFRIETTMIAGQGNNPLKFSISPEMALESMVRPARGYQQPEDAAREALDDIKAHEIAMVTGMEAALKGVLAQLSPQALEGRITSPGTLGAVFKGRKARYWEAYEQLYAQISQQAEQDFHDLFAKEFARAYEAQLQRLKAHGHHSERR